MKINKTLSPEPRRCRASLNLSVDPNTLKTLIPEKILKIIQAGDPDPYYVIEEIEDIRKPANRVEFTPDFWNSYLSVLKDRPIPGSKKGHLSPSSLENPENDLYTIGGKIENNKVFLKIYIPTQGSTTSNDGFIRDIKAGLIHFSIVSWTEDIIEIDEDGTIKSIKAVKSVKGERNDAVEVGLGAMDQKVNKDNNSSENNKSEKEKYIMSDKTYNEVIQNIINHIDNGKINKIQVASDLKIEIVTDEHRKAVKMLKEIEDLIGKDPVDAIKKMKKNEEAVKKQKYENVREKEMADAFGPLKIKVNGKDTDNLKRQAAEPMVSKEIQDEKKLKDQIEQAKNNPVVKQLSFQYADMNSPVNNISGVSESSDSASYRQERVKIS